MKISISAPNGLVFEGESKFVLVSAAEGEFAILKDHVPVVAAITEGYIKTRDENQETFIFIAGGVLEQSNNVVTVIAQEATSASTLEEAKKLLLENRKKTDQSLKKKNVNFLINERDLQKNIKKIKASEIK